MSKAEKVMKDIEKVAAVEGASLPIIGHEKGSVLENVIKEYQPKLILEIGTLVGYSAILMGKNLKKGKIISVEINKKNHLAAKANIERAGLSDKIELVSGDALEVITNLDGPFDMVFIDAKKEEYLKYLKAVEPKMTKNAIVVSDNVGIFKDRMKEFLDYLRKSGKYRSELHDFGFDGVEVSKRIR